MEKELTRNQFYKAEELLEEAENMLRFTELDDEANLINKIRNYLRIRASKMKLKREVFN